MPGTNAVGRYPPENVQVLNIGTGIVKDYL
jgi:hypothetical protein